MNTEYTLDENGNIETLTHNSKPVKAGYMRGLRKAQATSYWCLHADAGVGTNPFSGVSVNLDALEISIYQWLRRWYAKYDNGGPTAAGAPIQTYDDMKYLLLEINSQAYWDLID